MTISLGDIWPIENLHDYKIHFARRYDPSNNRSQPLEVWTRSAEEWQGWQEYMPGRNDFNRPFIFSLIQFYHEPDIWLFGGVFRVLARHFDRSEYEVELTDQGQGFSGRLKLRSPYRGRTTRTLMESHYANFEVQEILREPYSGRSFPGYDEIDISFEELETLVRNNRPDWASALQNMKGIYLITDTLTGGLYVGSAYGDQGIWARWCTYVGDGHGGNTELQKLVKRSGIKYCRSNFQFSLLEAQLGRTPDDFIQAREAHWKRILLSRGPKGLNRN